MQHDCRRDPVRLRALGLWRDLPHSGAGPTFPGVHAGVERSAAHSSRVSRPVEDSINRLSSSESDVINGGNHERRHQRKSRLEAESRRRIHRILGRRRVSLLVLAVFTWYRRVALAEYHISYGQYSFALVKALVLAKLILIGSALRLGRSLDHKPLIVPALWKAGVF